MPTEQAVLLVDDSPDTLEMSAIGLARAGYRPITASDPHTALGQLKIQRPVAVVTDLQLVGGRGGWQLIEAIKKNPATRQITIVVRSPPCEPRPSSVLLPAVLGRRSPPADPNRIGEAVRATA